MKKWLIIEVTFLILLISVPVIQSNGQAKQALQGSVLQIVPHAIPSTPVGQGAHDGNQNSSSVSASNSDSPPDSGSTSANASINVPKETLQLLQDTPEHTLASFYDTLLVKNNEPQLSSLFYPKERYAQMVTDTFYDKVSGFKDRPTFIRQAVESADYALYTITYTLSFKDVDDPVPFYDVLPLIKQDGKWFLFIDNPAGTPLEKAINTLYNDPVFIQAQAQLEFQLQDLYEKYPALAEALA